MATVEEVVQVQAVEVLDVTVGAEALVAKEGAALAGTEVQAESVAQAEIEVAVPGNEAVLGIPVVDEKAHAIEVVGSITNTIGTFLLYCLLNR